MNLTKSQRVQIMLDVANHLGAEEWSSIDLILSQFGLPTDDFWQRSQSDYVKAMIQTASDNQLIELSEHFKLELKFDIVTDKSISASEYWADGHLRVFISHLTSQKQQAAELKNALRTYSMSGFVAHNDINPTSEWQNEIETALNTCDLLVALIHPDFVMSNWCDQEIGYALGRGVPVFAVRCGTDPHGFVSRFQAFNGVGKQPHELAKELFRAAIRHKKLEDKMPDVTIDAFTNSFSYIAARERIAYVEGLKVWSPRYTVRIEKALQQNDQIYNSSGMPERIEKLLKKWAQPDPEDSSPF